MFESSLPDLVVSNMKHKQSDVLQGLPAGLAGLISTVKQLQSSWSMGTWSYDSSASCSCSIVHEALMRACVSGTHAEGALAARNWGAEKGEMSWRQGLKWAFKLGGWFNSN